MNNNVTPGIPDELFIRGKAPITKEEIRTLSISKLRLNKGSTVADIGAGTGSISIEIARLIKNGIVYAVEKNNEAVNLIKKNIEKFRVNNIKVIHGKAPEAMKNITKIDRAFVGGSSGKLAEILKWIDEHIIDEGRIVVNAITLETLTISKEFFHKNSYSIEIVQIAVTRCEEIGNMSMLKALNPVFIISAQKNET